MSRVGRYVVMGGVMDLAIYIALSLVPLLAERAGAGSVALGVIPVTWGAGYAATALLGGRISDRVSRTALMRLGLGLVAATCLAFRLGTRLWHFYAGLPVIALGMAFFWPALQAAIADESTPRTLGRHLGWFNVTWSAGKGFGVLGGGLLVGTAGRDGFLVAGGIAAVLLFLSPRVPRGGGRGAPLAAGRGAVPGRVRERFRVSALLANFAAFGLGTTVINQYPDWNAALSRGGGAYGVVVGGIFLAQTLGFAVLLARPDWSYRRGVHLAPQLFCAAAAVGLAGRGAPWALLPCSAAIGFGFAISYFSSIYYSLHSDVSRGGRAGLHETVLGTGHVVVPFLAGAAAHLAGTPRAVYPFAAGVVLLSAAAQGILLRGVWGRGAGPGS